MTNDGEMSELVERIVTDQDRIVMDGVSFALHGEIGLPDDVVRLRSEIEGGPSTDKLEVACKIAVAFIRYAQELKGELTKQAEHLAECIRSHQKVNAEVEELEAKLDKQSERVRELEAATWRLIEAASRVVNLHEKNLPIYDSEFNELARRVMYAVQAMPAKGTTNDQE